MADSRRKASKEPEPALERSEGFSRPASAPKRKVISRDAHLAQSIERSGCAAAVVVQTPKACGNAPVL